MVGKRILWSMLFVLTTTVLVTVTYDAAAQSGRRGMGGMKGMGSGRMHDGCAGGVARPETPQIPLTQGRKEIGEAFLCPLDGRRRTVAENTPATEYRGKTYYFCSQEEKKAFFQNPDRYVGEEPTESN